MCMHAERLAHDTKTSTITGTCGECVSPLTVTSALTACERAWWNWVDGIFRMLNHYKDEVSLKARMLNARESVCVCVYVYA